MIPAAETLALSCGPVPVVWRRSRRARRVSLRIDPCDACVVVTLPARASRAAGLALLAGHADWAAARLAALPRAIPLADGAAIPIDGVVHPLRHVPDGRGGAWIEAGELRVSGDPAFLARRTGDFLRAEARRRVPPLVRATAARAGLSPSRITLKDTATRWGSCSSAGVLMFSWRLIMAPRFVQEYVAAHEVAHLRHMNHGPRFWQLVAELTPHTDAGGTWLRDHGTGLLRIG